VKNFIYFSILVLLPSAADAYIGPGLGMGVIGVMLGILVVFVLTVVAIIWYPLKRLIKLVFRKKEEPATSDSEEAGPS
jgi:hypothetical protein